MANYWPYVRGISTFLPILTSLQDISYTRWYYLNMYKLSFLYHSTIFKFKTVCHMIIYRTHVSLHSFYIVVLSVNSALVLVITYPANQCLTLIQSDFLTSMVQMCRVVREYQYWKNPISHFTCSINFSIQVISHNGVNIMVQFQLYHRQIPFPIMYNLTNQFVYHQWFSSSPISMFTFFHTISTRLILITFFYFIITVIIHPIDQIIVSTHCYGWLSTRSSRLC